MNRPALRLTTGIAGIIALLGIAGIALVPPSSGVAGFPGALLGASILTAVAILAGVWPRSWFGPAIDARLLRWIGDRSYGIYLWHWPLLVLAVAAARGTTTAVGFPVWIGIAVLVATLIAAELSYRFVETPIRRHGFRGSMALLGRQLASGSVARLRALGVLFATVLVLGGTSAAIAAAPAETSSEAVVEAGQAALDAANKTPPASPDPGPGASAEPGAGAPAEPGAGALPPDQAAPSPAAPDPAGADSAGDSRPMGPVGIGRTPPPPAAVAVSGDQISAVGDSVMLASVPALFERLPGIQVDAAVSRSSWAGPGILESLAAGGQLRPFVVIALGTNGPVDHGSLERMVEIAGPDRRVVLVNAFAPRDWIAGVNADLDAFAASHPGVVVADWSGTIGGHTDLLAGDSIHPDARGGKLFAETVAHTVDAVKQERAQKQYEIQLRLGRELRARG